MTDEPAPTIASSGQVPPTDTSCIGKLDADRVCQRCLHQLHGTPVYRDERLQILYVRCSECGTHAAVTEFPHSWKWLRRASVVLAVVAALIGLVILIADVTALSAGSHQSAWEAIHPYANALSVVGQGIDKSQPWQVPDALRNDVAAVQKAVSSPTVQTQVDGALLVSLLPLSCIAVIGAFAWTAVLFHRPLWVRLAFQAIPITLAALFTWLAFAIDKPPSGSSWSYGSFAMYEFGGRYLWIALGWMLTARLLAVLSARPFVVLFLRLVVPKRVRQAVASVWSDDNVPG